MDKLISVIVPVYNTKRYLRRCMNSILEQTYPKFEILLVNDASTDGSSELCKEYADKYDKVTYIELEHNMGVSYARNVGLKVAQGELVGFVDSDDWIEPETYEVLYQIMDKYSTRIASCLYYEAWYEGGHIEKKEVREDDKERHIDNVEEMLLYYISRRDVMVTNKLFDVQLFNQIKFPEGRVYEDTYISYRLMENAGSAAVSDQHLYNCYARPRSITHSFTLGTFDYIRNVVDRYEYLTQKYKNSELEKLCRKQIFEVLMTITTELYPSALKTNNPAKIIYEKNYNEIFEKYNYNDCGLDYQSVKLLMALQKGVQHYMISNDLRDTWYGI